MAMHNIPIVFTLVFALATVVACGRSPLSTEGTVARTTLPDAGLTDTVEPDTAASDTGEPDTAGDEICDNFVDDDGDGAIDCNDSDCRENDNCRAPGCPDVDLGDALGLVWEGTTEGAGDDSASGCGGFGAPEVSFVWRAARSGEYFINTLERDLDTVLYVRRGTCTGLELECDSDTRRLAAEVSIIAAEGDEFVIFVDGRSDASGETGLVITLRQLSSTETSLP